MRKFTLFLLLMVIATVVFAPAAAQDDMAVPHVDVVDQVSLGGVVHVDAVYSDGPGFVVIHMDNGGSFGPVIGYRWVNDGWSFNVDVRIDASSATGTLYAMLHSDTGEVGVYEFGSVEGADSPVAVDGAVVAPAFNVDLISAWDQFVTDGTVTVASVVAQVDGWIVIHSDNDGRPGPVLGASQVSAGQNSDVVVELSGDATNVLWPMLHVDTGAVGEYEFGTVEGADGPVVVGGTVAVTPFWTVPHARVADQVVTYGDGMEAMMGPAVHAASVLSDGPGFLVIHADNGGSPGPVLGATAVNDGLNTDVVVELEGDVTPVLWPMMHVDTGEVGTYEFGTVEGADGPVRVGDSVVTFPINAAPSIDYSGSLDGNVLTVSSALIDAQGFLVIHADNGGSPGPVIGYTPLVRGVTTNVVVTLDEAGMTETVFPMLHYDTGEAGVYEFGAVEGADGPVRVGGNVVVGPLTPAMGE